MLRYYLIGFIVYTIIISRVRNVAGDEFEECDGVADEAFVASKSDCKVYIYCMGDESLSGECDEGQYFDPEALACDAAENVYCALDAVDTNENAPDEIAAEEEITIIATTTTTTTATTTTTSEPATTSTSNSIISSFETEPATTTTPATILSELLPALVQDTCPTNDNPNQIVFITHNQSCSDYYVCYHGHYIEMHCSSQLYFNAATAQCDYPENVHCMHGGSIMQKCHAHITDFFPHPKNCNYFYYCIRGYLTVQQCPFYYGWDVERRACVQISKAKCFNSI